MIADVIAINRRGWGLRSCTLFRLNLGMFRITRTVYTCDPFSYFRKNEQLIYISQSTQADIELFFNKLLAEYVARKIE